MTALKLKVAPRQSLSVRVYPVFQTADNARAAAESAAAAEAASHELLVQTTAQATAASGSASAAATSATAASNSATAAAGSATAAANSATAAATSATNASASATAAATSATTAGTSATNAGNSATAAATSATNAAGSATAAATSAAAAAASAASVGAATFPRGIAYGLNIANNASDSANDIDVTPGYCADATNSDLLTFGSGMTKRLDALWSAGSGNGMLDSGSVANGTYGLWAIGIAGTATADLLASTSLSAPNMPSGYNRKRLIGLLVRVGGSNVLFTQSGANNERSYRFKQPKLDVNSSSLGTSSVSYPMATIPVGLSVYVWGTLQVGHGSAFASIYVRCPFDDDLAPSYTAAPGNSLNVNTAGVFNNGRWEGWTDTSAQIAARSDTSSTNIRFFPAGFAHVI